MNKQGRRPPHQFKPGQSGNPKGRPKGSFSIMTLLVMEMKKRAMIEGKKADKTYAELFVKKLLHKTIVEGDSPLMREIIQQVDGAPRRKVELSGGIATGDEFGEEQMARIARRVLNEDGK